MGKWYVNTKESTAPLFLRWRCECGWIMEFMTPSPLPPEHCPKCEPHKPTKVKWARIASTNRSKYR